MPINALHIYTNVAHTHDMFSTKQRSAWAQWRCVWTKPSFVRTQLCFVRTACAQREAEMCARTFWLREDEAELCQIEHFRKNTARLRPAHMTAAFSSLRDSSLQVSHIVIKYGILKAKNRWYFSHMRTATFEIYVYRLVYRALRQKILCVAKALLVNPHSRDFHTRSARVGLTNLSPLPHNILLV